MNIGYERVDLPRNKSESMPLKNVISSIPFIIHNAFWITNCSSQKYVLVQNIRIQSGLQQEKSAGEINRAACLIRFFAFYF